MSNNAQTLKQSSPRQESLRVSRGSRPWSQLMLMVIATLALRESRLLAEERRDLAVHHPLNPEQLRQSIHQASAKITRPVSRLIFQKWSSSFQTETRSIRLNNPGAMPQAIQHPVCLLSLNDRALALFGPHVYLSHYQYANRVGPARAGKRPTLEVLSTAQPWFRWNGLTNRHELQLEGATSSLVRQVSKGQPTVKLYRGTAPSEITFLESLRGLTDEQLSKRLTERLRRRAGYNAFFYTPSREAAALWSKGAILEVEIPTARLQELAQQGRVYAGVENNYVELAFFDPGSIRLLVDTLRATPAAR
jgi:hypothetical protein